MLTAQQREQLVEHDRETSLKILLNITSLRLADSIDGKDGEAIKTLFELYCKFSEDLKMLDKCK